MTIVFIIIGFTLTILIITAFKTVNAEEKASKKSIITNPKQEKNKANKEPLDKDTLAELPYKNETLEGLDENLDQDDTWISQDELSEEKKKLVPKWYIGDVAKKGSLVGIFNDDNLADSLFDHSIKVGTELNWLEYTLFIRYQCLGIQFSDQSINISEMMEGHLSNIEELLIIEEWFIENNKNFYIKEISNRSFGSALKEIVSLSPEELFTKTKDMLDSSDK